MKAWGVNAGEGFKRWCDPEWVFFTNCMLCPGALLAMAGEWPRASFFLGIGVYLSTVKWLGWVLWARYSEIKPPHVVFAGEVLVGLTVACWWFYLRNALTPVCPPCSGIPELTWLFPVIALGHGTSLLLGYTATGWEGRRRSRGGGMRALDRVACYGPYCLVLVLVLWNVSGKLDVQTTDSITHASLAKAYLEQGCARDLFHGEQKIAYPTGFGVINAVTAAVSPLSIVQAVNLQHPLLLITGLFFVAGAASALSRRSLWVVHSLPVAFLSVFPLHSLYPDVCYEHAPMQVMPALAVSLCLLPLVTRARRTWQWDVLLGIEVMMAVLAAGLNPACVPFAAIAFGIACSIHFTKCSARTGATWIRTGCVGVLLVVTAATLFLTCDRYYSKVLPGPGGIRDSGVGVAPSTDPSFFSWRRAASAAWAVKPWELSPHATILPPNPDFIELHDWPRQFPQYLFPAAACVLGLFLGLAAMLRKAEWRFASASRLRALVLGCIALWVGLKYGMSGFAGGLSPEGWDTRLLRIYVGFLLIRCELVLLFVICISAIAVVVGGVGKRTSTSSPGILGPVVVTLGCALPYLLLVNPPFRSGLVVMPSNSFHGTITLDDVRLARWIDANLPAEGGLIGVAAVPLQGWRDAGETHLYPIGGARALVLYGTRNRVCFTQITTRPTPGFQAYQNRVQQSFDADWCVANDIHYFYVPVQALAMQPSLAEAVSKGSLVPVRREESACLYRIVPSRDPK